MNNHIRKIILFAVCGLVIAFGASLYGHFKNKSFPIQVEFTDEGIDVQIQDFKVEHESSGRKDWEIKAKTAKINNEKQRIDLDQVHITYNLKDNQKSYISADKGVMNQETKDIELEGNVRFTLESGDVVKEFLKKKKQEPTPQPAGKS